jgi:flavin reductase (DIM6/NTAB) family NADH-FMN oxidoreductase RutF
MSERPVDATTFRKALACFATGIVVVSVRDTAGTDHGMTVSAFCSASLYPPLVLTCIGHDATIAGAIADASVFGVSVLSDGQANVSRRFARPGTDRFEGAPVLRGALGVALLPDALAHIECRIVARHEAGDHTIVVGEVVHADAHAGAPLAYFNGDYARLTNAF